MTDAERIKEQIRKIEPLHDIEPYSADYELWDTETLAQVRRIFGEEKAIIFKNQQSVAIPHDRGAWKQQYRNDLQKKRRVLENLLADPSVSLPEQKERFARFKNQILGGTVLRDTSIFEEMLGDMDFQFWRDIAELAPYLQATTETHLDNRTKGKVIIERLEKEPSPRRFAELLKAVYETLVAYSGTPKNEGDMMWLTYVHRLQAERDASHFTDLEIEWKVEPETAFTREFPVERYKLPGDLSIVYHGQDWGEDDSRRITQEGFGSAVLQRAMHTTQSINRSQRKTSRGGGFWDKFFWNVVIALPVLIAGGLILHFVFHVG